MWTFYRGLRWLMIGLTRWPEPQKMCWWFGVGHEFPMKCSHTTWFCFFPILAWCFYSDPSVRMCFNPILCTNQASIQWNVNNNNWMVQNCQPLPEHFNLCDPHQVHKRSIDWFIRQAIAKISWQRYYNNRNNSVSICISIVVIDNGNGGKTAAAGERKVTRRGLTGLEELLRKRFVPFL